MEFNISKNCFGIVKAGASRTFNENLKLENVLVALKWSSQMNTDFRLMQDLARGKKVSKSVFG